MGARRFPFPLAAMLGGAAAALMLAVSACGADAPVRVAPVTLSRLTPPQGTRVDASAITLSGTVKPARASVMVLGRRVRPGRGGRFSASVPLKPGVNLIDVIAGAPHARAAMTAVRVTRYVLVTVPAVDGRSPQAAAAAIRSAGLRPRLQGGGDPFSFLLPLAEQICGQVPAAGRRVEPGSTVTLSVGKVCI